MKKLVVGISVAFAAVANADTVKVVEKDAQGAAVTKEYDALEYAQKVVADKVAAGKAGEWTPAPWVFLDNHLTPEVGAQVDTLLAANRFFTVRRWLHATYPRMWANYASAHETDCPELVPVVRDLVASPTVPMAYLRIVVINSYWNLMQKRLISDGDVKELLKRAPTAIKHRLRSEGKSFVTKDGVNPVQERLDLLSAALNAPRLNGINAALQACGMDFGLDFEQHLLPSTEVEALKAKTLNGDVDIKASRDVLRTHLGVTAYNGFVRLYNGEG